MSQVLAIVRRSSTQFKLHIIRIYATMSWLDVQVRAATTWGQRSLSLARCGEVSVRSGKVKECW